ncbi:MAG: hypothetical protein WAL45_03725 [Terracidiphilus sp.]
MKNVTVSISDTAHLRARVWAAEHETSLSAVVAYLLQTLPKIRRANLQYPLPPPAIPASGAKVGWETVEPATNTESAAYGKNPASSQNL